MDLLTVKCFLLFTHTGLAEIPAPIGGSGSDVIDEGLILEMDSWVNFDPTQLKQLIT